MNCSIYLIAKRLRRAAALGLMASLAALINAADFGVADWGASLEDVKRLEQRNNLTPFGERDYLIYAVELEGIDKTRIIYQFADGKLVEGRFLFSPANALDVAQALRHYQAIKQLISRQYGEPMQDATLTPASETASALQPADYANELAADRLILKSRWHSETTKLHHQLAWRDDRPHHQLHYLPLQAPMATVTSDAF